MGLLLVHAALALAYSLGGPVCPRPSRLPLTNVRMCSRPSPAVDEKGSKPPEVVLPAIDKQLIDAINNGEPKRVRKGGAKTVKASEESPPEPRKRVTIKMSDQASFNWATEFAGE